MDSRLVNISSLRFSTPVVISFLIFEVTDKEDQQYMEGIDIPVFFLCISGMLSLLSDVDHAWALPRFGWLADFLGIKSTGNHLELRPMSQIYLETVCVVVLSYVTLLEINWSYISLAVFPVIAIGFILALWRELNQQTELGQGNGGAARGRDQHAGGIQKGLMEGEALEAVALVPYWVLCMTGQFHADKFAVSKFLLFVSIMLGALTQMMTRLVLTGVAPGVAPASVLFRRASLVVLLVTVHAVAAELLGEEVVFSCLLEFVPVLLWFSIHLDRGGNSVITADKIKQHGNRLGVFGVFGAKMIAAAVLVHLTAVLGYLTAVMDAESVLSWSTKLFVACGLSGLLIYYVVFMLRQWSGDGNAAPYLQEAVKLLKYWANALLKAAAMLMVSAFIVAVRLCLHEPMAAATVECIKDSVARLSQFMI